ncbi:septum formation family protein [Kitasatospora viridis]|uniref:Uncharacterized protein DUF4190 n=1 Tax=Kitasatospora viridis TaxID=281105 RepID=A0A561UFH0_9ACTN|nr:septum formation family protein [Kitasatospora viridis]TWF98119.1 uncharacterized protein DUF4190 [Kitasatospora viridis]
MQEQQLGDEVQAAPEPDPEPAAVPESQSVAVPEPAHVPEPEPAPAAPGLDGFAVAALVCAVTVVLWPLALAFGAVARVRIRRRGGRGGALAVSGLLLSLLGVLTTVGLGLAQVLPAHPIALDAGPVFSLHAGDCFDRDGGRVRTRPCTTPHEGEMVGTTELTGDSFPTESQVHDQATPQCQGLAQDYAMDHWLLPAKLSVDFFYPSRAEWEGGRRTATCVLMDQGGGLTGPLRRDRSTLSADQYRYLRAMDAIDLESGRRPAGPVAGDPVGYREWAGTFAEVLRAQTGALRSGDWGAAVRGAAGAQADELDLRAAALERAAAAPGPDELAAAVAESDLHKAQDRQLAVRQLLRLATVHGQGGAAGGGGASQSV